MAEKKLGCDWNCGKKILKVLYVINWTKHVLILQKSRGKEGGSSTFILLKFSLNFLVVLSPFFSLVLKNVGTIWFGSVMSRVLDKWLTPIALFMKINYLVHGDDNDVDVVKEVLSVANDDSDDDDDVSDLLQQVKRGIET